MATVKKFYRFFRKRLLLALSLLLIFCSGCDQAFNAKQSVQPSAPPALASSEADVVEQSNDVSSTNDNPYAESISAFDEWRYDLFEDMRGAQFTKIPEAQNSLKYALSYEAEISRFEVSIALPQLSEPWADGLNQYYMDYFEQEKARYELEYQQYLQDIEPEDFAFHTLVADVAATEMYTWDRFCLIAVGYDGIDSRTLSWPRIDVFDTQTGKHLGYKDVFNGEQADWEDGILALLPETISSSTYTEDSYWLVFYNSLPGTEHLVLTPKGVGFQYRYGELTSMVNGAQRIIIPFEKIRPFIKDF